VAPLGALNELPFGEAVAALCLSNPSVCSVLRHYGLSVAPTLPSAPPVVALQWVQPIQLSSIAIFLVAKYACADASIAP